MKNTPQFVISVLFFAGCASSTADSSCASTGTKWTGGNSASSVMNPGMDCIACHTNGHGPRFAVAGTVYSSLTDADTCDGLYQVSVELKAVDTGETVTATSNSAGNFSLTSNQMFKAGTKFTARVITPNGARAMVTQQTNGACNSCHTATGLNGAPGRIVTP